jgi:hypothetical protein
MMEIFIPVILIVKAFLMKLSAWTAFGFDHLEQDDEPLQKLRLSISEDQLDEPSSPSCVAPVVEGSPGFGFLDPGHPPEVLD